MGDHKLNNFMLTDTSIIEGQDNSRSFYPFYVGIDIGSDFHVAACIPFEKFRSEKEWKRSKTMKFNSDSQGITKFIHALEDIQAQLGYKPQDFFILLEPTGGHYSYLVVRVLLDRGYSIYQVENKAVKDFRERQLGLNEKSDEIDARIMAYMGWHKTLHPDMRSVRIVRPASAEQVLYRTLTRDRWLLTTQLTRRKNQVQQLFSVTNPELKRAFKKTGGLSVLKLALKYPTAQEMAKVTQDELRQTLITIGAKTTATKASTTLAELLPNTLALDIPHLAERQTWLIEEALRIDEAIKSMDKQIASLLYGDKDKGYQPHPYTKILMSFPIMSESMACTFIGAIGDIERFSTYLELKKYLGVAAENKISGTSVFKSRQTYEGVRDTRRVLFLMTLLLISPKISENSFRVYYKRLVDRGMAKRKAIGHVCGKIAQVLYSCLKNNESYDPFKHASKMGVILDGDKVKLKIPSNLEDYERQADELADDDDL
ncbi:IS110 family transposase [Paenibacillus sp. MAH-36]